MTYERRGRTALIALNRPSKKNAVDAAMLREFIDAVTRFEDDDDAWTAVIHANGSDFTAGFDLVDIAAQLDRYDELYSENRVDPWGLRGRPRTKPLITAVQGWVMTLGIELALASDICVASAEARFAQLEVSRGIYPFGGATLRFPSAAGWGNAMRWMLTGEAFDANEARRLNVVHEVVAEGRHLERALELAEAVNQQAPLGVRAVLASARQALDAPSEAAAELMPRLLRLAKTNDAIEGVVAFSERRKANFIGR